MSKSDHYCFSLGSICANRNIATGNGSDMTETFDVCIVGGAAMGSAVAYFLSHDLCFKGRIALIERNPSFRRASTALSAASIRQQFSTPENIHLSQYGVHFITNELRERFGSDASVSFHEGGYLLLAAPDGAGIAHSNHAIQRREGAATQLLGPDALARRFPFLSVDGLALGSFGPSGEGWFDAYGLMGLMRRAALDRGVVAVTGDVKAFEMSGDRLTGVALADGRRLSCAVIVNASGPQAGDVAAMAGLSVPVEPRKRSVFVVSCRTPISGMPLIVDTTGVYVRPEGDRFICGVSPVEANDPRADGDFEVDHALFDDIVWPALAARIPAFEALKVVGSWAGHYDYNTLDQNALLGPHPARPNLLFAAGFSGHGIQQAPAVGRAIAEWIVHGRSTSLDLDIFSVGRLTEGRAVREINVI
jgi:FAD-dependent oxidoreductase domain-containing protein 1